MNPKKADKVDLISIEKETNHKTKELGTSYFKWERKKGSLLTYGLSKKGEYSHSCPIEHFIVIANTLKQAFQENYYVTYAKMLNYLEDKELSYGKFFAEKSDQYKIRMCFGIFEMNKLIIWTGTGREKEYTLNNDCDNSIDDFIKTLEKTSSNISIRRKENSEYGSNYFKWEKIENNIIATARKEKPYTHKCPIKHFLTITKCIMKAFEDNYIINNKKIIHILKNYELETNRYFRYGKKGDETYKISITLSILERKKFLEWTGSSRPKEYKMIVNPSEIHQWLKREFGEFF